MRVRARGTVPLAHVVTYGCQGNVADSEKIRGYLAQMGFGFTEDDEQADFILFNTCAIREHAQDRVFGNVGALKNIKRRHPGVIIALCGCMVQQKHVAERIYASYPFVNLVFGTHVIHKFPELLYKTIVDSKRVIEIPDETGSIFEGVPLHRDNPIKAWLPIMYGCNNFCSYCIVPYVRGRERSRESADIIADANVLISEGYRDITLLGQNVNSYGKNLAAPKSFASLAQDICELDGDFWLRFMTSHPKDCTKELLDTMAANEKMAKHLHLPFQSGSNRVLKEMNRRYTKERYLEIIDYAREKMPDISLTSDVIVGFPGETYEEFCETLELIKKVEFTSLYTFIFSPRVGTPAEKMDDPVPYEEKSKWFSELLKVQEQIAAKRTAAMVGQRVKVLAEGMGKTGISGRTGGNVIVEFEGDPACIGKFVEVEVTSSLNWILKGKQIV
ncbi:MAG: tRNA (N6-isopentenyl adenosine(37)-C2)-methylthiotransferase MiaB [Clostridia bacterium]|nr:tRNA (N6-isopentenyl adenosine(37)-C2)-methylthiotransferase MiaB [Clostridia bacterium]